MNGLFLAGLVILLTIGGAFAFCFGVWRPIEKRIKRKRDERLAMENRNHIYGP